MQQSVEYRRKGLISGGVLLELLISTQLGFVVMLASMLLGLPVWVNVLLLVGTITAVLHVCSAEIHYRVDADGLTRFIEPRVLKSKQLRRLTHIDWSRIESYTVDHDRNRSWQAYPYLLIKGKEPSFQWKIAGTSMEDATFDRFVHSFVQSIPSGGALDQEPPSERSFQPSKQPIQQRRGFYRTKWAKLLALLLAALDVIIVFGVWTGSLSLSQTGMYRLVAVLLPGTVYVLYRTLHR